MHLGIDFERFWWILGGKLGSKIEQKSIPKGIEKVMKKRRSTWGVLGASWAVSSAKSGARSRIGALLWPGYPPISLKKGTLHAENLQTLYRSPASGPRHAAGLLRARCGSKAQQSCVSATALEQKIMRGLSIRINRK